MYITNSQGIDYESRRFSEVSFHWKDGHHNTEFGLCYADLSPMELATIAVFGKVAQRQRHNMGGRNVFRGSVVCKSVI